MDRIRIGIMGFGHIGRQLYQLASGCDDVEVTAVSDVGAPEILHHLLTRDAKAPPTRLVGNFLDNGRFTTRMLRTDQPREVPWDAFAVDAVVDATGRFRSRADMQAHLDNGAHRVVISSVPQDHIDRVVIPGINTAEARAADRMISAGSASTTAMALVLHSLAARFRIALATMTSVHAYTSDQSLQDYAGADYRRSRSAAENIIPNTTDAPFWVEHVLPALAGKLNGYALNVPIQRGSLLDLTVVFDDASVDVEDVNAAMSDAALAAPTLIAVAEDPIVSSDVIGSRYSVLFDLRATLKAGQRMIKTLSWHESLGHAQRILDVLRGYAALERGGAWQ
jgi:glyceraldehyde 3-phosphate dehydrogenase (phosphorylating)